MRPKYEPDSPPPGSPPDGMNKHLQPTWYKIHNEVVADQAGVKQRLAMIRENKKVIRFLKTRVVVNKAALDVLGEIKEPVK